MFSTIEKVIIASLQALSASIRHLVYRTISFAGVIIATALTMLLSAAAALGYIPLLWDHSLINFIDMELANLIFFSMRPFLLFFIAFTEIYDGLICQKNILYTWYNKVTAQSDPATTPAASVLKEAPLDLICALSQFDRFFLADNPWACWSKTNNVLETAEALDLLHGLEQFSQLYDAPSQPSTNVEHPTASEVFANP